MNERGVNEPIKMKQMAAATKLIINNNVEYDNAEESIILLFDIRNKM
jgi:hypothetical protein